MLSSSETKHWQVFSNTASRPGNCSGHLLQSQAIVRSANRAEDISGLRIHVNPTIPAVHSNSQSGLVFMKIQPDLTA